MCVANPLINSSLSFLNHALQLKHSNNRLLSLNPINSRLSSNFLQLISAKLSTRVDNDLHINLKLSINFILYAIDSPLSSCFLIGTEKVIYFSVFSPKHSNCPSNSFVSSFIIK